MRLLLQTVVPAYRVTVFRLLADTVPELSIVSGDRYFDPTVVSCEEGHDLPLRNVRNRYLLRRKLLWQSGAARTAISAESVVAELNPRILSNWFILLVRWALGRRTLLWGHASRRGDSKIRFGRRLMARLADAVVAYTHSDRELFLSEGIEALVAPNALYSSERIQYDGDAIRDAIVFVGRLVAEKQPDKLLSAFASCVATGRASQLRLVFVGSGPELEGLRLSVEDNESLCGRVEFRGQVNDFEELREVYRTAVASASPGYVGLSLIQSLSLGVAMIVSEYEAHSPEIEAALPAGTVRYVVTERDWIQAMSDFATGDVEVWDGDRIAAFAKRNYSLEVMVEGLSRAFIP